MNYPPGVSDSTPHAPWNQRNLERENVTIELEHDDLLELVFERDAFGFVASSDYAEAMIVCKWGQQMIAAFECDIEDGQVANIRGAHWDALGVNGRARPEFERAIQSKVDGMDWSEDDDES